MVLIPLTTLSEGVEAVVVVIHRGDQVEEMVVMELQTLVVAVVEPVKMVMVVMVDLVSLSLHTQQLNRRTY